MKRVISLALLIAMLAITFVSCDRADADIDASYIDAGKPIIVGNDVIIYFYSDKIRQRFDLETRRTSVVCPDPLCEHNDDSCFAYNKIKFFDFGEHVYAMDNGMAKLYMYDLARGETKMIYDASTSYGPYDWEFGDISDVYEYGGYAFFFAQEYEFVQNENGDEEMLTEWSLYRYDIKNDKVDELTDSPSDGFGQVIDVRDGRLVWEFDIESEHNRVLFSTDLDYSDRKDEQYDGALIDGFAYTRECIWGFYNQKTKTHYDNIWNKLTRTNIETGLSEAIVEHAYSLSLQSWLPDASIVNDGFYYTDVVFDAEEENYVSGNTIYHSTVDGETEVFYEAPDGFEIDSIFGMESEWLYIRCHYTADEYDDYVIDEEGGSEYKSTKATAYYYLFINIKTGETFMTDDKYKTIR